MEGTTKVFQGGTNTLARGVGWYCPNFWAKLTMGRDFGSHHGRQLLGSTGGVSFYYPSKPNIVESQINDAVGQQQMYPSCEIIINL